MKKQIYRGITALLVMATTIAYGQNNNNDNRQYDDRNGDSRSSRYDDERNYRNDRDSRNSDSRNNDDRRRDDDRDRSDRNYRSDDRDRNTDSDRYRDDSRTFRRFQDQDLQQAYDKGYDDGMSDYERNKRKERKANYKNFAFGLYGGLNSLRLEGEGVDGNNLSGRVGYQLGVYVRGGGRIYGQIGIEYLTSSSQFYSADSAGKNITQVLKNVDQRYLHIPAYVGVKLAQSPRGMSAVRLQVGAELATVTNNTELTFNNSSINALADLGFDAGPLTIDFVYHYGFNNTIKNQVASTKPRILGVNVGFKF